MNTNKSMKILAIESSCDETAVAVVENGCKVLVSHVFSQVDTHKLFGGVVPEIAAREHLKVLDRLVRQSLDQIGCKVSDMDAIAVTQGPGLAGALLVGISYAKGLALRSGLPLIPVNHVHGHVHGALLSIEEPQYPSIALVVSGGHTNIYYLSSPTDFELLAYTLDDACGECFDKVAKLFDLGYPGGPIIERLAREGDANSYPMPHMVQDKKRMLFSYSGLKTYMVNLKKRIQDQCDGLSDSMIANILASFQDEALGQLVRKLESSVEARPEAKSLIIAGGVAANKRFRFLVDQKLGSRINAFFPELKYCADNAAMIGALGYFEYARLTDQLSDVSWDCFSRYQFVPK